MQDRTLAKNMVTFSKTRDVTLNLGDIRVILKEKNSLLNPICKIKKVAKIGSIDWNKFLFSSIISDFRSAGT